MHWADSRVVDSSIDLVGNVSSFIVGSQEVLLIASIVFMPDVYTALLTSFVATLIGGFSVTGGHSLMVEQAPKSRGTMMSVSGVFASIGVTIGSAVWRTRSHTGFSTVGANIRSLRRHCSANNSLRCQGTVCSN